MAFQFHTLGLPLDHSNNGPYIVDVIALLQDLPFFYGQA
jgi:hypothetical protein